MEVVDAAAPHRLLDARQRQAERLTAPLDDQDGEDAPASSGSSSVTQVPAPGVARDLERPTELT